MAIWLRITPGSHVEPVGYEVMGSLKHRNGIILGQIRCRGISPVDFSIGLTSTFETKMVILHFSIRGSATRSESPTRTDPEAGIGPPGSRSRGNKEAQAVDPGYNGMTGKNLLPGMVPDSVSVEVHPGINPPGRTCDGIKSSKPTLENGRGKGDSILVIYRRIDVIPVGVD